MRERAYAAYGKQAVLAAEGVPPSFGVCGGDHEFRASADGCLRPTLRVNKCAVQGNQIKSNQVHSGGACIRLYNTSCCILLIPGSSIWPLSLPHPKSLIRQQRLHRGRINSVQKQKSGDQTSGINYRSPPWQLQSEMHCAFHSLRATKSTHTSPIPVFIHLKPKLASHMSP